MTASTTSTDPQAAVGLVAYKAVVEHALEHHLSAPTTMDIADGHVSLWISSDPTAWLDSVHVDAEHTRPSSITSREIVYTTGRLPALGIKVLIKHSRPAPATLWAVS